MLQALEFKAPLVEAELHHHHYSDVQNQVLPNKHLQRVFTGRPVLKRPDRQLLLPCP
jgi:hypothetical protein